MSLDTTQYCAMCEHLARERDSAIAAHCVCDRERQAAFERIRELESLTPAQDEDYRYRVEQIASRIVAECAPAMLLEDEAITDAIRQARKLIAGIENMDRG